MMSSVSIMFHNHCDFRPAALCRTYCSKIWPLFCVSVILLSVLSLLVVVTKHDAAEITASAEDGRRGAAVQCFVRGGAGAGLV